MKPDLTSSETGRRPRSKEAQTASGGAHLSLVNPRPWTHTLILTGELNRRSAPALEEEIEGLCQEGVAALRLDLRQLDRIDLAGIAVIAFRSQECIRRGCSFAVLTESPAVQRALIQAGVILAQEDRAASEPPRLAVYEGGGEVSGDATEKAKPRPTRRGRLARWLPGE